MRAFRWAVAILLGLAATTATTPRPALAQDISKPEDLRKMYDDVLGQLKAAQDRKNELARENERLAAKLDEMQKDLAAAQREARALKQQVAENADKTFYLRSFHAACEQFMSRHPDLRARWQAFLEDGVLTGPEPAPELIDPRWPLSARG